MKRFSFPIFAMIAKQAYEEVEKPGYTLEDTLTVFKHYFDTYEEAFGRPHACISKVQIKHLIEVMPGFADELGRIVEIEPQDYFEMIDSYFQTDFKGDYNINHFFSGNIRLMRFYEAVYQ